MTSIGETLRRERVRRNLDLGQIANDTKISARLLEAIEAEQFDKLPGGVFTRSFVRQYARYLELDGDELVSELDRMIEPPVPKFDSSASARPETPPAEIRIPKVEEWQSAGDSGFRLSSSLPAVAMVVLVMLVCSGIYTWWQRPRVPAPAPEPHPQVAVETPPPQVQPAPPAQQQPVPDPVGSAQPPAAQAPVTTPPPTVQPVPESKPPVPEAAKPVRTTPLNPNAPVQVQLTAAEPTWVLVRTDGKYLFSGTLQANETRSVEATGSVLVRLGNAGGVGITLNGKSLGMLGPKGQVRTVQLSSEGAQIVPAAVRAPATTPAPDPL